jgi:predicted metal-dependent enzyme (double-stranded beta helix superfamily)
LSPHVLSRPALLDLAQLSALTRTYADEVHAGRHQVVVDPARRWYNLLRCDDQVSVWLISWATEQFAELHDHGDSHGAFTVIRGALTEDRWVPARERLRRRVVSAGRSVAFGTGYVHEVSNPALEPAVSVHAYSPPLTEMSYYALDPAGGLHRTRSTWSEATDSEGVG